MPKMKTHKGSQKRFRRTGNGRQKKRDFRRLWIARINAAARQNEISYSRLMHGLKQAGIEVNRKMLADIAVTDEKAFADLAQQAKAALK